MTTERRPVGNEAHWDPEDMWKRRFEVYEKHKIQGLSLRALAREYGVNHMTISDDIRAVEKRLREELPDTVERWQMMMLSQYNKLNDRADELYGEAKAGAQVKAMVLRLQFDILNRIADLFGVPQGVQPPRREPEDVTESLVWVEK